MAVKKRSTKRKAASSKPTKPGKQVKLKAEPPEPAPTKRPPKAKPGKTGRPTMRTRQLEDEILDWISDGKTLREFCRRPGSPSHVTVHEWRKADPELSERFARARLVGADMIAEEILEIADTPKKGVTVTEDDDGRKTVTEDMLGHRRLQIDARLKLLAKWFPQKYGDKIDIEHSGKVSFDSMLRSALGLAPDNQDQEKKP